MNVSVALLLLVIGAVTSQERSFSSSRRNRFSTGRSNTINFHCPEDFGYYPHPDNCSHYYVCVFGGALLESCTGGLMYSTKLMTCDWPRNVVCKRGHGPGVSTVKITDPRTSSRHNQVLSATEAFTSSASVVRNLDNTIRRREPLKSAGSSKSVFDDSKLRQGRFVFEQVQPKQKKNTPFQAQETSSRSFNVLASSRPSSPFFPPLVPGVPAFNPFAAVFTPTTTPKILTKPIFNNLQSLKNDTAYYDYYEDLDLYYDYYDTETTTTTVRPTSVRSSSRSRINNPPSNNFVLPVHSSSTRSRGSSSRSSTFSNSLNPSPATLSSPFIRTTSGSSHRSRGTVAKDVKKSSFKTSSSRGSSLKSTKSSSGGSPQVVGRTPQRPTPVRAQPQVDTIAQKCDRTVCRLPDCYCGEDPVPGNIRPENVPQMVLLTFDDSVNDLNKKLYIDLFEKGRVNPNGCPISATFYVSHEWTDYSQVQNLYADGHEIASHSITHSFGEKFSTNKWAKEIGGQREIMSAYGGVKMEDIRGMRAPFLAIGGNNMFRMLYNLNFTYDSSMPVYENRPPSWPFTLDYKVFHDCMIPPCPTKSYPGVWQVPMVMWQDLTGGRCSMSDACTTPPDAEGVYQMLIKNFERHYRTNRSPFGLFYHAAWFTTAHHKEGFIAFLDTIAAMDDVWLITNWQALEWVRDPVPLSRAKSFKPFKCDYPERPAKCTQHRVCNVWHKGSVRYLKTCQRCPDAYPWVGKTGVQSPLNSL